MGTTFHGKKLPNNITISKSGSAERRIDPDSGKTDRSFAQPNPVNPPKTIEPQAHASAQDEVEALNQNSKKGRAYKKDDDKTND